MFCFKQFLKKYSAIEEFYNLEYDEYDEYTFGEFIDIETSLKEVVDNEGGGMGDFRIQLRDGHYRVM